MRAKDLDREVRALASAPGHVCFSLTEDWVENHFRHRSRHLRAVVDYCLDRNNFHRVSRAEGPSQLTWMSVSPQSHALPVSDSPRVPIVC